MTIKEITERKNIIINDVLEDLGIDCELEYASNNQLYDIVEALAVLAAVNGV